MDIYQQNQKLWLNRQIEKNATIVHGFTVDPFECRDPDDGLSYKQLDTHIWEVQIAIANMPATIPLESDVYDTAYQNVRSIYKHKGKKVQYMLPDNITEDLCSLKQRQIKPAIGIQFQLDLEKNTIDSKISEIVFYADRNMTYTDFSKRLAKDDAPLVKLTQFIQNRRLSLLNPDQPTGRVLKDSPLESQSHIIIAEWMQLSNNILPNPSIENQLPYLYRFARKVDGPYSSYEGIYSCDPAFHPGVGYEIYSHSSSPIRRLPDLCNQFNLTATLNGEKVPLDREYLSEIAKRANDPKYFSTNYMFEYQENIISSNSMADFFSISTQKKQRNIKPKF